MESDNRKRLGGAVVARRTELGMRTTKALAELANLSTRMLGDVENGRRSNFSPGAKAQIERALQWEPGSIDSLLAGGESTPSAQTISGLGIPSDCQRAEFGADGDPSIGREAWRRGIVIRPGPAELTISGGRPAGNQTPEKSQDHHVPDFLTAAKMTWAMISDLADSPEGDPDRDVKAARAVVSAADTLTDALLRLNVGPTARELIQEMAYQSHQLMQDQGHALQRRDRDEDPPPDSVEDIVQALIDKSRMPGQVSFAADVVHVERELDIDLRNLDSATVAAMTEDQLRRVISALSSSSS
ncbi:helix-turn-helix domain-containing protein [Mycolicibacter arupensis]|uniref:HTH cro/C1-type domain-containing protein n=1 Tax=Mycolicibacter arupensis TaxID=342002 RepID=A0A5C7XL95_9MYCO|nr:helix-turn-helix transcriptional regulator [Mycolicibacter arupensis]MCV7275728.1 hypothetical protein [Mycolicibacter arupensis]TXI50252.1 MAG: hypothetical protein E6Q54_21625 [Mycolicibacter arupensis]